MINRYKHQQLRIGLVSPHQISAWLMPEGSSILYHILLNRYPCYDPSNS